MVFIFLPKQKISNRETPLSNDQFLSNCSVGIDEQYEILNDKSWSIVISKNDNIESNEKNSENDHDDTICNDRILAYNNNTLDKMMLVHAYQQQFGEVGTFFKTSTIKNKK